ncbi:N-acetylglucosamine-6-phosphate deacetylase [Actinocatenispora comari]|uniref:N-acetylglucosamine-6-phosphate deacetylase n=1 Tax=Actinocatenispora comari TaxID=2807577 RepID=UPI001A927739|nr:N-acetylglucosamine-6-phosphate deacetylase [Actinocatenispora comari]
MAVQNLDGVALVGARVLRSDGRLEPASIEIEDGRIARVVEGAEATAGRIRYDLAGRIVAPGMIDTHVHGRLGHHVMSATRASVDVIGRALLAHGTTSFVAATATVEYGRLLGAVTGLAGLVGPVEAGAELLGIHLEGPFLSPVRRGVHPLAHLVAPTPERLDALLEAAGAALRICTLAPELDGASEAIKRLVAAGVRVAAGHTDASYARTAEAVAEGVTRATHLFNGMPPVHHRKPGPVPALLADPRVRVELVADGVHVAPELVGVLLRAPDLRGRVMFVSDGTDVAGLADGPHRRWEGTPVVIRGGAATTLAGAVAGGTGTVLDGVRLAVDQGVPVEVALAAGSHVPADSLGLTDRGRIAPGQWADLLVLTETLDIETTILHGVVRREES